MRKKCSKEKKEQNEKFHCYCPPNTITGWVNTLALAQLITQVHITVSPLCHTSAPKCAPAPQHLLPFLQGLNTVPLKLPSQPALRLTKPCGATAWQQVLTRRRQAVAPSTGTSGAQPRAGTGAQ